MINIRDERLLRLDEVPALLPIGRNGRPVHRSTIHRWIAVGVGGHRLEAIQIGGTRFSSAEALQRFARSINAWPVIGQSADPDATVCSPNRRHSTHGEARVAT